MFRQALRLRLYALPKIGKTTHGLVTYALLETQNNNPNEGVFNVNIGDRIALALVVIGALNWGLIGLFNFDLVAALFGQMTTLTRLTYSLVGLAGLWSLSFFFRRNAITTEGRS